MAPIVFRIVVSAGFDKCKSAVIEENESVNNEVIYDSIDYGAVFKQVGHQFNREGGTVNTDIN